jgi:hypothetical protein
MGRVTAVRSRGVLSVAAMLSTCLAAGSLAGQGSAHSRTSAPGCNPAGGEIVALRLSFPVPVARADVGDTLKVIAHVPGGRANTPEPFDHKHAVCRISVRRVSKGDVIARFRVRRAPKEKIRFGAGGVTSSKGCPRGSHGCPRPVLMLGYVKVRSSSRSLTG